MNFKNSISSLIRLDKKPIQPNPDEIIVFACVRNEYLRLAYFLDYYRSLGVDRFILVDNASTDGSVDFLLSEPDVHIYYTKDSYAESKCGVDWLNHLLTLHGTGHWTLTLDADELIVYPQIEDIDLRKLTQFFDQNGTQGLTTFLLDMYSKEPIKDALYKRRMPFQDVCPFFDWNTYHKRDAKGVPVRGGPRHRLFWEGRNRKKPSPVLKKIPLVKWREGLEFEASTHTIKNLRLACLTGVLQHYKFFSDFYLYAEQETARKEHWDESAQYESYWEVLREDPNLSAYFAASMKYTGSAQLIELGLISSSEQFECYVNQLLKD